MPDVTWGAKKGWFRWNKHRKPGDYMRVLNPPSAIAGPDGSVWYIVDPYGRVGRLSTHTVEEHDDGTITVSPSILEDRRYTADEMEAMGIRAIIDPNGADGWHGWLERGVWRQA